MIAKSDLVILTLSTAALAVGIVRWQHGTTVVPSVTVPASARVADAPARVPEVASLPAVRAGEDAAAPTAQIGSETSAGPAVERLPAAVAADPTPAAEAPAVVRLPAGDTIDDVTVDPAALVGNAPPTPRYGEYLVRSGDYLGLIAQRHGTTVDALREINGIQGSTIQIGQRIRYPLPGD